MTLVVKLYKTSHMKPAFLFVFFLITLVGTDSLALVRCQDIFSGPQNNYSERSSSVDLDGFFNALKIGDRIIDSNLGFLKVLSIGIGEIQVVRLDLNASKQMIGYRTPVPFTIRKDSGYKMAKVGTPESAKIIKDRITRFYGFRLIQNYFAFYRILELYAGKNSNYKYKARIEGAILMASGSTQNPTRILIDFAQQIFNGKQPDGLKELIDFVERATGENLVQTGILATLERRPDWKADRWPWPQVTGLSGLPKGIRRRSGKSQWSEGSVEMDVDHFARTALWKKNQQNVEESPHAGNIFKLSELTERNVEFYMPRNSDGKIMIIDPQKRISDHLDVIHFPYEVIQLTPFSQISKTWNSPSAHWKKLFEVATTSFSFSRKDVDGSDLTILISSATPNLEATVLHVTRKAWLLGARNVRVIRVHVDN